MPRYLHDRMTVYDYIQVEDRKKFIDDEFKIAKEEFENGMVFLTFHDWSYLPMTLSISKDNLDQVVITGRMVSSENDPHMDDKSISRFERFYDIISPYLRMNSTLSPNIDVSFDASCNHKIATNRDLTEHNSKLFCNISDFIVKSCYDKFSAGPNGVEIDNNGNYIGDISGGITLFFNNPKHQSNQNDWQMSIKTYSKDKCRVLKDISKIAIDKIKGNTLNNLIIKNKIESGSISTFTINYNSPYQRIMNTSDFSPYLKKL